MDLLVRGRSDPDAEGHLIVVTPASAGWRYVGFAAARLRPRERRSWRLGGREACVVLLAGHWPSALVWKLPLTYAVPFIVATLGALGTGRAPARP